MSELSKALPETALSRTALGRFMLYSSLLWVAVGLLFAMQLILLEQMPLEMAFAVAGVEWLPWIGVTPLILWLSLRLEFTRKRWLPGLIVHLALCIGLVAAMEWPFRVLFHPSGGRPFMGGPPPSQQWKPEGSGMGEGQSTRCFSPEGPSRPTSTQEQGPLLDGPGRKRTGGGSFLRTPRARMTLPLYWALVTLAHAWLHYQRSIERERRARQAEAGLVEARLANLQSQLNPHFLFNTLNTIAQYIREDAAASEHMIEQLASLLRASLAVSGRRVLTLGEELSLVDSYLEIQQARFPDRLKIRRQIDPDLLRCLVPTLLLQPLVENAILHGIARRREGGVLELRVFSACPGRLVIEVADTGDGAAEEPFGAEIHPKREGVGLRNTRERLEALYGSRANFVLLRDSLGGLCSRIEMPLSTG